MLWEHGVAGSNPVAPIKRIRPLGQAVKTSPFHGGNTGSSPVEVVSILSQQRTWAFSSVGQSSRLITDRSGVQVPEGPSRSGSSVG